MTTPSLDRRGSSLAESNASSTPSSSDTEEGGDNDAFSEELGPASPSRRRPGSSGGSSTAAAARRGKKSPPSAAELSQNFKLLEIERALTTEDSLGGLELLRELSVSKAGLVNDEMRRKVWPRLANVTGVDTDAELPTQEDCEQHPEYNQVSSSNGTMGQLKTKAYIIRLRQVSRLASMQKSGTWCSIVMYDRRITKKKSSRIYA
jgi:hypothetical protein